MAFRSSKKKSKRQSILEQAKEYYLQLLAAIILLVLSILNLKTALWEQAQFSPALARQELAGKQQHPKVLYNSGLYQYLNENDTELALTYFTKGIENLSLYIPAFIRKAELLAESGHTEQAMKVSNYVDLIAPDSFQWRWDRTMLAYSLDQYDLLAKNLSWFVTNNLGKRWEALSLATATWDEAGEVLDAIDKSNSPHLLKYYIKSNDLNGAEVAWDSITGGGDIEQDISLQYTNFLINNGEIEKAKTIWKNVVDENDINNLIQNADFHDEIIGSGFGWRLARKQRQLLEGGEVTPAIVFSGRKNLKFNLHQLIAVVPGRSYIFSVEQKAANITTDQRPFWQILGYKCGFSLKSESITEVSDWHNTTIEFLVPESCNAVWVVLRRNESFHFDNKISGTFLFNNLKLIPNSLENEEKPRVSR